MCVPHRLRLGPPDMNTFGNPCFNVLWPSQLYPRLRLGELSRPPPEHSCAEGTRDSPGVPTEVFKKRQDTPFSISPSLAQPWRNFYLSTSRGNKSHHHSPPQKEVSLNSPCDRSCTNHSVWRVNPVRRLFLSANASVQLKSSVEADERGKYDEMSLHFLPRLQAG